MLTSSISSLGDRNTNMTAVIESRTRSTMTLMSSGFQPSQCLLKKFSKRELCNEHPIKNWSISWFP